MIPRVARLELISAATKCVALGALRDGEELVIPVDAEAELVCRLRAVGLPKPTGENMILLYSFSSFDQLILKAVASAGKLTGKQIAARLNCMGGDNKPSTKLRYYLARLEELNILADDGEGCLSVSPPILKMVPSLLPPKNGPGPDAD